MELANFETALNLLKKRDPFVANCICESISTIEEVIYRDLSNEEKMIAFTMFNSGILLSEFLNKRSAGIPNNDLNVISLN